MKKIYVLLIKILQDVPPYKVLVIGLRSWNRLDSNGDGKVPGRNRKFPSVSKSTMSPGCWKLLIRDNAE